MKKIILASKSPRRAEILQNLGVDFTTEPANTDESVENSTLPQDAVKIISRRKAEYILSRHSDDVLVISADTVVTDGKALIGKPKDETDAFNILKSLSGKTHLVCTGFTLCDKNTVFTDVCVTSVKFRDLSDDEICRYIATGEPMDKAGAYGIQGKGSLFVEGINGDYFNVVGLPVSRVSKALENKFGICLI